MKAALLLTLACTTAQAEFMDGNKLLSDMRGDHGDRMHAIGYVLGVYDMGRAILHCAPSNITAGQIHDMVRNYLDNTPAERHLTGDIVVNRVLKATWPCPKKGNAL